MADLTLPDSSKEKAAWKRPETWFTWGPILAIVTWIALNGLDKILPLIIRVFENTLYMCFLGAALFVIGYVLFDKDFRQLVWYGYKMMMKRITRVFVEIDPIAIMETYIDTLKERYQEITDSLKGLRDQRQSLTDAIKDKTTAYNQSFTKMNKATEVGGPANKLQIQFEAREQKRIETSAGKYQELLNKIVLLIGLSEKFQQASLYMVKDIEATVDDQKQQRKMVTSAYKAMTASRRILQGGKDRELFDLALEVQKDQYFNMMGEIEQFWNDSQSFINGMDLENGIAQDEATAKLAEWDQRSAQLLDADGKFRTTPLQLNANNTVPNQLPAASGTAQGVPASQPSAYDKLFQ